jgi:hypothetical protein
MRKLVSKCVRSSGMHPSHKMRPPCTNLKCYHYTDLLSAVGTEFFNITWMNLVSQVLNNASQPYRGTHTLYKQSEPISNIPRICPPTEDWQITVKQHNNGDNGAASQI